MEPSRWYERYLALLIMLGAVALGSALALLGARGAAGAPPSLPQLALTGALAVGSYVVLRNLLLFQWRGQHVALGPDEVLVFVALLALPGPLVILFAAPAMALFQFQTKRPFLRGATNVAVMLLATTTALGVYAALDGRVPPLVAALAGIAAYTPATFGMVSVAFALRERSRAWTVYRERFVAATGFHLLLGATGGVVVVGLWKIHPLALLAIVPMAFGVRAFTQLLARSDREARVHQRLGEVAHELAGEPSLEIVAARVLDACVEIFHAGRAAITLAADDAGNGARRWARDSEAGHDPQKPALAEVIPGPQGPIGAIVVHASRATTERFTHTDRAVLRIVAGGAAAYVAHARALAELDESRRALLSQRVARPLVRRIVREIMEESHADHTLLARLGNGLAREPDAGSDLASLCAAYEEMGLGSLRVEAAGAQYVFTGSDLFERQTGAHATTCHIALGFLCGAVSRLNDGAPARGAEISCQSRGDAECRFVVQKREPEPQAGARGGAQKPAIPRVEAPFVHTQAPDIRNLPAKGS